MKSQSVISSLESGYGGRRTLPFVYTEQGISMLASVLHTKVAVDTSIKIMRAFVKMRHFIASNALMFERISNVELQQLEYQKQSEEKFDKIFEYISDHEESSQKIFFDGQIFDAYSLLSELINQAKESIILIDGYVDLTTLEMLSKKSDNTSVVIYTLPGAKLTKKDIVGKPIKMCIGPVAREVLINIHETLDADFLDDEVRKEHQEMLEILKDENRWVLYKDRESVIFTGGNIEAYG